jgi:hypothetical protein
MRPVVLLFAFLPVAATFVFSQTSARTDSSKDTTVALCQVSGRVVTAADNTPLKSAHVLLEERNAGRDAKSYGATSDGNGNFILKSVVPGRYRMVVSRNGSVTQEYQSHSGFGSGAVLALGPGQAISGILFRLMAAAVITGHIADEDSEPLANVQVIALRKPDEDEAEGDLVGRRQDELDPAGSARTDDRGIYRIFGLSPGQYYLRAAESMGPDNDHYFDDSFEFRRVIGKEYSSVYFPGVLQRSQAEIVPLKPAEESQVNFTLTGCGKTRLGAW